MNASATQTTPIVDPATPATAQPAIERTLRLAAEPSRVWRALTQPEELNRWFGQRCAIDLRPGGEAWMEWDGYGRFAMRVEAVEPECYLAVRWASETGKSLEESPGTLVEWTLEPGDDGGTLLRLRESGFTTRTSRLENVGGWVEELAELMDFLALEPWEVPIRRVLHLSAPPARVWRALTDPRDFCAWWGSRTELDVAGRTEGWFDFPEHGRYAVRVEAVEPERYFAWSWSAAAKDTALADAHEVLLTEWLLQARPDGGTDLHLVESGFRGPDSRKDNTRGWDGQLANLEKALAD
jgi:uncharacterized protein YndB with AHSA1/START domain